MAKQMTTPMDVQTSHAGARIEIDPSRPSGRLLYLDGIECSYVDLADPGHIEFGYVRRLADAVDLIAPAGDPVRVTHLGGGGFSLPGYVAATRPGSRQLVYEYDQGLIELARTELGLRTSPQLRVKVGDARTRLERRSADSADVIVGDAFVGRHIPEHLASVEFGTLVRTVLRPGGIYAMNVIDDPPLAFARAEGAVLLEVFPHVLLSTDADVLRGKESGNIVYLASDQPLPFQEMSRRAGRGNLPERVIDRAGVQRFVGTARPLYDESDIA